MPKLRGHHLICLQFFTGDGYNQSFIENLKEVLVKIEEGIEVIEGADDICKGCPYLQGDICKYDDKSDMKVREMDEVALKLLIIERGREISWKDIRNKIPMIFDQWFKDYCYDCDWLKTCKRSMEFINLKDKSL